MCRLSTPVFLPERPASLRASRQALRSSGQAESGPYAPRKDLGTIRLTREPTAKVTHEPIKKYQV